MATTIEIPSVNDTTKKHTRQRCVETKSIRLMFKAINDRRMSEFLSSPAYKEKLNQKLLKNVAPVIENFQAENPNATTTELAQLEQDTINSIKTDIQNKCLLRIAKNVVDVLEDWIENNMHRIRTMQPVNIEQGLDDVQKLKLKTTFFNRTGVKGERKYKKEDDMMHLERFVRFVLHRVSELVDLTGRQTVHQKDIEFVLSCIEPIIFQNERAIATPEKPEDANSGEAMDTDSSTTAEPVPDTAAVKTTGKAAPKKRAPRKKKSDDAELKSQDEPAAKKARRAPAKKVSNKPVPVRRKAPITPTAKAQ